MHNESVCFGNIYFLISGTLTNKLQLNLEAISKLVLLNGPATVGCTNRILNGV